MAFADRSGPDTNSRFVRDLFVITLTCDPPTSTDRMTRGRSCVVILRIDCFLHCQAEATRSTRRGQAEGRPNPQFPCDMDSMPVPYRILRSTRHPAARG